ncbi:MAG: hypothetical protein LYZ69_06520 [Nitrososphaerales archaeon]|nr:hypothetical protein [Nitrososphaerales archaeon]
MEKSKILAIAFVALFLSASYLIFIPLPARASSGLVVAFDYYHVQVGNQTVYRAYGVPGPSYEQVDRAHLFGNLTKAGYTISLINGSLSSSALQNVNVLFLGKLSDLSLNYTTSEVQAIKSWFQTGDKLLMVSGDSDYTSNDTADMGWHVGATNHILTAIGSQLRLEIGEVTDQPGVGASGAGFRVYANSAQGGVNSQGWANNMTANTQKVRFHGTTNVIGWSSGKYVDFGSIPSSDTVTWLYRTSPQGTVGLYGAAKPYVSAVQSAGQYVLAAAEKIPEGSTYSKVIVAGAGFYGNYVINADTEFSYNITFQGLTFILNAIKWGTTSEAVPSSLNWPLIIGAAAVIIIIVAAAAAYVMRRKPKPQAAAPR